MIHILLTQGKETVIDDCDKDLSNVKWCYHKCTKSSGYATRTEKGQTTRLHVIIGRRLGLKGVVDHKDGNTLNNCRSNLRDGSGSRNNQNRRCKIGISKYKGVSFCKREKKWRAYIKLPVRRFKSLGYFETEQQAAVAYNRAAAKYFGEYAVLNIIN